jgi:hypothetical protein
MGKGESGEVVGGVVVLVRLPRPRSATARRLWLSELCVGCAGGCVCGMVSGLQHSKEQAGWEVLVGTSEGFVSFSPTLSVLQRVGKKGYKV